MGAHLSIVGGRTPTKVYELTSVVAGTCHVTVTIEATHVTFVETDGTGRANASSIESPFPKDGQGLSEGGTRAMSPPPPE